MGYHTFLTSSVEDLIANNVLSSHIAKGKFFLPRLESDSHPSNNQDEKQNLAITPKTFVAEEKIDGQMVNVVDGLKLYEKVLDGLEIPKLVSLVNLLRAAGRVGQFPGKYFIALLRGWPTLFCLGLRLRLVKCHVRGHTYILSKRPMKGHGREMIQFGLPIADAPAETENETGTSKGMSHLVQNFLHIYIKELNPFLQCCKVIERLVGMQVMTGDYSQPHMWPPWFGKPVSVLFLTECELTFGRVIETLHQGDYRGSLKLSLVPGSLLVMQGKSSDMAKHAIPMIRKQRILITFTEYQPNKFTSTDGPRLPSHSVAPSSHWSQSMNHLRHPVPKHYAAIPTTAVLPVPSIRPQIPPPNGVQPIFMTTPAAAPMPYPAPVPTPPVSTGWPTASSRHPSARLPAPIPGTGVFLPPPGSGHASSPLQLSTAATEMNFLTETASLPEKENGPGKSSCDTSGALKEKLAERTQRLDCNGIEDGRRVKREEQQSVNHTVADQSAGAV
ncbi:hypothetical protein DKX38_015544 [Salix brachista]|uniref:Alpha-ketoglutarate-dependent dioxygenase AlkB-like domain-containing protein n=1 Tax=Salix brachista TaxID=2182728 RepID=A0A5N5L7G2_9ROSI|nr:hypothetical protein DKX38_015544 [Salix brachista]